MLSGLVLAGGRSSRMGRDKAMLRLADGRTLLERQVAVLREAGAGAVQVSVRTGSGICPEGATIVEDDQPDAGPLAGIAAGLRRAPPGLVVVLAVDMPAIATEHLQQLLKLTTPRQGVVPWVGGKCEPLVAVYPAALAGSAGARLADGQRAVHAWVDREISQGTLRRWDAPADWAAVFKSWNSPEDLPRPARPGL